jgi:hypothetical protein
MRCRATTVVYYFRQGECMKKKRWRWWIVPSILTILFEVVAAMLLALGLWYESNYRYSFQSDLFTYLPKLYFGVLIWPLFLGLVRPAALIIHGAWKGTKAKRQGVLPDPEVRPGPSNTQ